MSPFFRIFSGLLAITALIGCGDDSSTAAPIPPAPKASNGITVISPNGGETFQVGTKMQVRWSSTNPDFTSALIAVGCGNGEWYGLTSTSVDPKVADTSLAIPDSVYSPALRAKIIFPASANCRLKISDYSVTSILDTSDARFTITVK